MKIRKLEMKDAPLMLEWMKNRDVVQYLQADFSKKTLRDCEEFIANSFTDNNKHWAIVSDDDIYMGTVSLKHIEDFSAEFAITIRQEAMGKEYSGKAMREIVKKAFEEYNMQEVYWCVSADNIRAVRFYDKNGYRRVANNMISAKLHYNENQLNNYIWYRVTKGQA